MTENKNLQQVLMAAPREAVIALMQMTMEILLSSCRRFSDGKQSFEPSNIAASLYTRLSLKPS